METNSEQPKGFFAKCVSGLRMAKSGIANASNISDLCILKIRNILQNVKFDDLRKALDMYKKTIQTKAASASITLEEKAKLDKKIESLPGVYEYIGILENFSKGGELEAPTDTVLNIINDIAEEKQNAVLSIIVQVVQVVIKSAQGIKQMQESKDEERNYKLKEDEQAKLALDSMISIVVEDNLVTEEEKQKLIAQAEKAHISIETLDAMIAKALE